MNQNSPDNYSPDDEHLRLLYIFHYVLAGFFLLFAFFPIFHVGFGAMMTFRPEMFSEGNSGEMPDDMAKLMGLLFMIIGGTIILLGLTHAALTAWSGRCIQLRKWRTFSIVVAGLNCLAFPFGTVLGVFTIIILQRPTVRALYPPQQP